MRSVQVSPATATSIAGDTLVFSAFARAACPETPTTVFWRSLDSSVAIAVGDSGRLRTVRVGTAKFMALATADTTVRGVAVVNVVPPLGVAPASATLNLGDRLQFAASVDSSTGSIIWSSSDTNVVRVSPTGLAELRTLGVAKVIATASANPHLRGTAMVFANTATCACFSPTISTITYGLSGTPVNLDSLAGPIDITVTVGESGTVDLIVNSAGRDTTVTTAAAGKSSSSSWVAVPRWHTDAKSPTGAAAFPNGAYTIRIRFHPGSTSQTETSTSISARVRNP